jgi:hypothetical protein
VGRVERAADSVLHPALSFLGAVLVVALLHRGSLA